MHAGGLVRHVQLVADLTVGATSGDQRQHLTLRGASGRAVPRRSRRASTRVGASTLIRVRLDDGLDLGQQRVGAELGRDRVRLPQ